MLRKRAWLAWAIVAMTATAAQAQNRPKGYLSLFTDYFPNQHDTVELRGRVFAAERLEPSKRLAIDLSGFAEGLLARRAVPGTPERRKTVRTAIVRVHDANVTLSGERLDLLAGYARVAWGKLDEIQPTDVVNPLDVSRFFFEGRSEARLPVLLVRGRWHVRPDLALEGIYVPGFRRGRFDRLEEPSSPFNLAVLEGHDRPPRFTAENAQGGARVTATSGQVDWSVAAYRGFEPFGLYRLENAAPVTTPAPPALLLEYPRFTMIGADFETVRGKWGLRGEAAVILDDSFQSPELRIVRGRSVDAGVGVDRRAGDYTVSATILLHRESYDASLAVSNPKDGRTDASLVASAERTFAREKYRLRTFAVYNPVERSAFVRAIGIASVKDNLALEASLGWFAGAGAGLVGRFSDSDFAYARLKYYFYAVILIPAGNASAWTGPTGNNTYLLPGGVPTLIDAGTGNAGHLEAVSHALAGAALAQVLLTHGHVDHVAGVPALRGRWPAVDVRQFGTGWQDDVRSSHPDVITRSPRLADGERIHAGDGEIAVLHTPGHSPDHCCFQSGAEVFCGDLVRIGGTVVIPASRGGDLAVYLDSLRRVRGLEPARLLPAHGPIIDNPVELIDEYLAHRQMRDAQILAALKAGPSTPAEIVNQVYGALPRQLLGAAADTVLAHLIKLRHERRVEQHDDSWSRSR